MLTNIQIDNFAIIDHLDVDFKQGMTVLTGETGAGKSIIVDALSLLLGVRADAAVVRAGAKRADITATFALENLPTVRSWLVSQELDDSDDSQCLIRRVINKEGRSKGFINGQPATLSMMKTLGEQLVDIHGQHAHQALLRPGVQNQLLDNFGNLQPLTSKVNQTWYSWKKLESELVQLQQTEQERHDRHELLDYQVSELNDFDVNADEIATIDDEYNRLANTNQLLEETEKQLRLLAQPDADSGLGNQLCALEIISQAVTKIDALSKIDTTLTPISELLEGASIQVEEAISELRHYQDQVEQDPETLQQLDKRLSGLHQLARKHRIEPRDLPDLHARLEEELNELTHSSARFDDLEEEVATEKNSYLKASEKLNKARHKAADKLNQLICNYLADLGMTGGKFAVDFEPVAEQRYSSDGTEKLRFLVTANPGQPLQPISKVASGGELSRISLAIQVVTVTDSSIPCLIFDEVDVGIGGGTAEVVGNLLSEIAAKAQVICVTHQAQVASKGQQHYRVHKATDNKSTTTFIDEIDIDERREEIARMIGGIKITDQTRKHAQEMLLGSGTYGESLR